MQAAMILAQGDPGTAQEIAWNQTRATASKGRTHHWTSAPTGSQTSRAMANQSTARAISPYSIGQSTSVGVGSGSVNVRAGKPQKKLPCRRSPYRAIEIK